MPLSPVVVTTGELAPSMPVAATASRSLSALSWVTWSDGKLTRYCAPPSNSMPMLRPWKYRPQTASSTMRPEPEYQSHLRPTKSMDFLPV